MKTAAIIVSLACLCASGSLVAQETRFVFAAGATVYDAGGDDSYFLLRLAVERKRSNWVRLGVGVSAIEVGNRRTGHYLRAFGNLGVELGSLITGARKPTINPWVELGVGVVHDAGRPTVQRTTGLAVGGGLGVDVRISQGFAVRAGVNVWRDSILDSRLVNVDSFVGLVVGLK